MRVRKNRIFCISRPLIFFVQCFKEALVAGPKNDDNYFEWDANILGPEDTCFEYG